MKGRSAPPPVPGPKNFRVALLIETSREFGRGLLRGIQAYEQSHGPWGLHVMPGDFLQVLPAMRAWGGTGIIARVTTRFLERAIRDSGLPFIGVSLTRRQVAPGGPLAGKLNIGTADELIAKMAVGHLLEQGLRNFAFVGEEGDPEWSLFRQRAAARLLSEQHGIKCLIYPQVPEVERDWVRERRRLSRWLGGLPCPAAIMAPTDRIGRQVIEACREAGLRVPEDAAVIGVDNDSLLCALCDPPMSSVALEAERGGWKAASLLDRLMQGQPVESDTILVGPSHVVARQSTATAHASDPEAAAARRFIIQQAHLLIQVGDVANHVGLPRRTLESRFRAATGQSMLEEIRRVRLNNVSTLLRETNASVAAIAAASGFASANYLAKVFHRVYAVSPQAFRARSRRLEPLA